MAHMIDTMFSTRVMPWHGLGVIVQESPTSEDALKQAGLDWMVIPKDVYVEGNRIKGYVANARSDNNKVLGIVSDRYKVVQNIEAFTFTDELLKTDERIKYETAGSLAEGKRVWLLAKMPERLLVGDETIPYVVFSNSHDGKGSIRVAMTPIRVVCQNTLNLAMNNTIRQWSTKHIGNIQEKMEEAKRTLQLANTYMDNLAEHAEYLSKQKISDDEVKEFLEMLFPITKEDIKSDRKVANIKDIREELKHRYYQAPDLEKFIGTKWGLINAVSDLATHAEPKRKTSTFREKLFEKTVDGNPIIDKAYALLVA